MNHPQEILAVWRRLGGAHDARDSPARELATKETETTVAAGRLRLAVSPEGLCSLLLPVSRGERIEPFRKSELIVLEIVRLGVRGTLQVFVNIRCEDSRLIEVFARVVSDIMRRIENGTPGVRSVDEALAEFRRLLRLPGAPDRKTIAGLIGELLTLNELLKSNDKAITAWHGPAADRHDFRAGGTSIEVKTSVGAEGMKVHINGISQLSCGSDEQLVLNHIRIEPDPSGAISVSQLVAQTRELVCDHDLLEEKLATLKIDAEYLASAETHCFRLVGMQAYIVRDGFPRLAPEMISPEWPVPGISAVTYELDLRSAADFRLAEAEWNQIMEEMCACL